MRPGYTPTLKAMESEGSETVATAVCAVVGTIFGGVVLIDVATLGAHATLIALKMKVTAMCFKGAAQTMVTKLN